MAFTNGLGARVALVLFASSAHQYAAIDPLPCDEVEAAIPVDITDSPPLDISLRAWFNNKASFATRRGRSHDRSDGGSWECWRLSPRTRRAIVPTIDP